MTTPPPSLGAGLAEWLLRNRSADGRLLDPVHKEYGTYADGWAALAFALMAYRTGDERWTEAFETSYHLTVKRPGDSEFDQLAMMLIVQLVQHRQEAPPGCEEFPMALRMEALYWGQRLVSNNWVAMRALTRTLLSQRRPEPDAKAGQLWQRVLGWQLGSGLFNDAPIGEATPITYHAKFCAMLALAALRAPEQCPLGRIKDALRSGLDALLSLVSPGGMLAPYGRSRNALFGYAAAVTAFRVGAVVLESPAYLASARRLLARMQAFQQPDGHIPCVLNEGEERRYDWDVYVNNPDYNAYAAGLLLLLDELLGPLEGAGPEPAPNEDFVREIGPVVAVRQGGLYAVFTGKGQSAPYGSPFFCDYRYCGMQPLYLEVNGEALFEPTPYQWPGENRARLAHPGYGWIPSVVEGGQVYCVRVYDEVRVEVRDRELFIEGKGVPEAYLPVSRWERGARGLLKQPSLQFRSRKLDGVTLTRALTLNLVTHELKAQALLRGRSDLKLDPARNGWPADDGGAK